MNELRSILNWIGLFVLAMAFLAVGFWFYAMIVTASDAGSKYMAFPFFSLICGMSGAAIFRLFVSERSKKRNETGGVIVTWMLMSISLGGLLLCLPVISNMTAMAFGAACYTSFFVGLVKFIARRCGKKKKDQ